MAIIQQITIPFTIGKLNSLSKGFYIFSTHEYYKTAYCNALTTITSANYLNENGIEFSCRIPISEQYIFNGPVKVTSFSDNIYAKVVKDNGETVIDYISIYFTTEKNPKINNNTNFNDNEENEKIGEDEDEEEEEEEKDEKQNQKTYEKIGNYEEETQSITSSTSSKANPVSTSSNKPISSSASPSKA